jgi:hypothetical protein
MLNKKKKQKLNKEEQPGNYELIGISEIEDKN